MEKDIAMTRPLQPNVINFPNGLIGLETYRQFILKELPDQELFLLLQSVEDEHFGLVVTNPFWFMSNYEVELSDAYAEQLQDKTNTDVFVTVSVAATPENITANLMGPILINRNAGVGFQVLSSDKKYTTQYKLMSEKPAGG